MIHAQNCLATTQHFCSYFPYTQIHGGHEAFPCLISMPRHVWWSLGISTPNILVALMHKQQLGLFVPNIVAKKCSTATRGFYAQYLCATTPSNRRASLCSLSLWKNVQELPNIFTPNILMQKHLVATKHFCTNLLMQKRLVVARCLCAEYPCIEMPNNHLVFLCPILFYRNI